MDLDLTNLNRRVERLNEFVNNEGSTKQIVEFELTLIIEAANKLIKDLNKKKK